MRVHACVCVLVSSRNCTGGSVEQASLTWRHRCGYLHLPGRPAQRRAHRIHVQRGVVFFFLLAFINEKDYCSIIAGALVRSLWSSLPSAPPRTPSKWAWQMPSWCSMSSSRSPVSERDSSLRCNHKRWSPTSWPFSHAPDVRRRTIYEYHKVDIPKLRISNYTAVKMFPLPSEFILREVQTQHTQRLLV